MIDLFSNSKEPGWTWPVTVALLATILLAGGPAFAQVDVVQTLLLSRAPVSSPPPAVLSESFIVTAPPAPTAIAILLPGGAGLVGLAPNGTGGGTLDVNSHNFVVRSRCLFAGHNLYTITLDAATDFYLLGGLAGYEGSAAHVSDILTVIAWARSTMPGLPVWIVGTSRGTGGAFVAGSYSPAQGGPDGLVFAASLNSKTDRDSLLMANLAGITVPALLINDAGSTCSIASTAGEKPVLKALTQSPRKGIEQVASGKLTALTGNCDALSDHGFFGIEDTAVSDIAVWMAILPATLTPANATYATQAVGTTSAAKTFTLTNDQTVTLTSIGISTTGDFAVSATTCTTSLAAKGKCTISVTFTPTETGTRTGELSVSDSASNSPQTSSLTGTGK
jgi:hypothetical protein